MFGSRYRSVVRSLARGRRENGAAARAGFNFAGAERRATRSALVRAFLAVLLHVGAGVVVDLAFLVAVFARLQVAQFVSRTAILARLRVWFAARTCKALAVPRAVGFVRARMRTLRRFAAMLVRARLGARRGCLGASGIAVLLEPPVVFGIFDAAGVARALTSCCHGLLPMDDEASRLFPRARESIAGMQDQVRRRAWNRRCRPRNANAGQPVAAAHEGFFRSCTQAWKLVSESAQYFFRSGSCERDLSAGWIRCTHGQHRGVMPMVALIVFSS